MSNTWFRFYSEALNDPKVQTLEPELFKHWINLLCIACNNNGTLPETFHEIAFALRVEISVAESVINRLTIAGLFDKTKGGANGYTIAPHNWSKRQYKSDTSSERVKRFRAVTRNVSETPPDTDTDTDTDTEYNTPLPPKRGDKEFLEKGKEPEQKPPRNSRAHRTNPRALAEEAKSVVSDHQKAKNLKHRRDKFGHILDNQQEAWLRGFERQNGEVRL